MASKLDIGNAIIRAYAYAIELTDELADEHDKGCYDCVDASSIECLLWLSEELQNRSDRDVFDKDTDALYEQLLEATSAYYGDDTVDINASIPYTIINVGGAGIAQWGFITGDITEQSDLMALLATKADIGDGIITPVDITIVGSDAIVEAQSGSVITWKIGTTFVGVTSPQTFTIADATDNYFRKDWIALTTTGMIVVQGVESQTAATPPNLSAGQIGLAIIDVYGDIINSNPPQPPVDISAPSWTVRGSVPFGKYAPNQVVPAAASAFEQYREAWTDVPHPNYVAPTAQLLSTPSTSGLEIGQSVNVNLTLNFTQNNAGAETSRVINKNGTPIVGITDTITIASTPVVYQGNVSYGQGAVLNNIEGVPDPVGRINAGSVSSNPVSYSGIYPWFYYKRSTPISAADMVAAIESGAATKVISSSAGTINVPYAPNSEYVAVGYLASETTKTRWFVSVLSQGNIPGGVFSGETTLPVDSPDGRWSNVDFKIHTTPLLTNPSAAIIELRNS